MYLTRSCINRPQRKSIVGEDWKIIQWVYDGGIVGHSTRQWPNPGLDNLIAERIAFNKTKGKRNIQQKCQVVIHSVKEEIYDKIENVVDNAAHQKWSEDEYIESQESDVQYKPECKVLFQKCPQKREIISSQTTEQLAANNNVNKDVDISLIPVKFCLSEERKKPREKYKQKNYKHSKIAISKLVNNIKNEIAKLQMNKSTSVRPYLFRVNTNLDDKVSSKVDPEKFIEAAEEKASPLCEQCEIYRDTLLQIQKQNNNIRDIIDNYV